jgi:hypothetical protein
MPLLIDGHNLIGKMPNISLKDPDDEKKLINILHKYADLVRKKITVIFDPNPYDVTPVIVRQQLHYGSYLTAIFAEPGVSADKLIRNRVSDTKDRQGLMVVTSDNAVASFVRQTGIRVQSSSDFAKALLERIGEIKHNDRLHVSEPKKPTPSTEDTDAWGEVFKEPPPKPKPALPKPIDKAALKRSRRMEQLKKQIHNQQKFTGMSSHSLTIREQKEPTC